jgi:hypothetical protein
MSPMLKKAIQMAKKKAQWERDFEAQDVKEQLHQITLVLRKEPDKGGELTRICKLAIKRLRYVEAELDKYIEKQFTKELTMAEHVRDLLFGQGVKSVTPYITAWRWADSGKPIEGLSGATLSQYRRDAQRVYRLLEADCLKRAQALMQR